MSNERFQKYIEYIINTGGSPKLKWFVADWEPIGEVILGEMMAEGLVHVNTDEIEHRVMLGRKVG